MRGLKKRIYKLLQQKIQTRFILKLSKNQVSSILVVVPKKFEIRINETYAREHMDSINIVIKKSSELILDFSERTHYFKIS